MDVMEPHSQRKKHCQLRLVSARGGRKDHRPGSKSETSSKPFHLSRWTDKVVRAIRSFSARLNIRRRQSAPSSSSSSTHDDIDAAGSSVDINPSPSLAGELDQSTQERNQIQTGAENDDSVGELAREHVLCPTCQESVNASRLLQDPARGSEPFRSFTDVHVLEISSSKMGCHLCSLFLGKIRHVSPTSGPVAVTVDVSRSGGMTFGIRSQVVEGPGQRIGELAVVPAQDIKDYGMSLPIDANFTFRNRETFGNAQIAKSISSNASFALAREWLQQCLHQHHKCSQAALSANTNTRPSRLIDVGNHVSAHVRVVVTQELNVDDLRNLQYLTLSHCWGGANILRLLIDNVNELTVEISMDVLPKTFQHAVTITRRLGYRYIWIDSLCIIQDSPDDWRICAAAMGEIYANSICTIAALTARNSYEGCFFDDVRNPLFFRPCRLTNRWYVEGNPNVGTSLQIGVSPLPLHTRAWVVQERILAPRTLYYGSNGLAWECTECSATEDVPCGQVSKFSPKASFFDILSDSRNDIYDCWTDIQISYTRCQLTRFSDRLVAISGVIKRIETQTGWKNVWGLWQEYLLCELLWFVEEPAKRPVTEQYLAPTWSWAGIEGRVMMMIGSAENRRWMAEVVDVGPTEGQGQVRIKGMMKKVWYTDEGKLSPCYETARQVWEEVDWDADVKFESADFTKELHCLLIARLPKYIGDRGLDVGLVMSLQGDACVRLGTFRQLREGNNLFPEQIADLNEVVIV